MGVCRNTFYLKWLVEIPLVQTLVAMILIIIWTQMKYQQWTIKLQLPRCDGLKNQYPNLNCLIWNRVENTRFDFVFQNKLSNLLLANLINFFFHLVVPSVCGKCKRSKSSADCNARENIFRYYWTTWYDTSFIASIQFIAQFFLINFCIYIYLHWQLDETILSEDPPTEISRQEKQRQSTMMIIVGAGAVASSFVVIMFAVFCRRSPQPAQAAEPKPTSTEHQMKRLK